MKLGGGVALPPRIPGKDSSEAVTGGERADNGWGGGFGRVSQIVAEAMAEVDAKMRALPTPPGSPLTSVATSLARRDVGRATNTDGLPRSGSCHSLSAAPDWRKMTTGVSRRCSSLTDLQTAAALSPATSGAALVESSPPSDHWEGEEWPGRPLRFCADLLPPPSAY